jgi:hypothetical protein
MANVKPFEFCPLPFEIALCALALGGITAECIRPELPSFQLLDCSTFRLLD